MDLIDGVLAVYEDRLAAALAAMEAVLACEPGTGRAVLAELGFTGHDATEAGGLVLTGFRGVLDGPADAALAELARFAADGTTLSWEDDNGVRWRYVVFEGRLIEQVPVVLWRDVDDSRCRRVGGVLADLRVVRCLQRYAEWWREEADHAAVEEAVAQVVESGGCELEFALHSLMLEVFQGASGAVSWLRVEGLRRGVALQYLTLDIEPARDGDGVLDGVCVVLNLHPTGTAMASLSVSVYVSRPTRMFMPSAAAPADALAEIVDTALALVNAEIADRDRFTFEARDALAAD